MGYTNRVYRNKMGVGMTWLRSLPNCQHHPILTQNTTTLCHSFLQLRRMHLHLHSHPARQNSLPNQEEGHLQQRALLIGCDSQAWRAYGPAASILFVMGPSLGITLFSLPELLIPTASTKVVTRVGKGDVHVLSWGPKKIPHYTPYYQSIVNNFPIHYLIQKLDFFLAW